MPSFTDRVKSAWNAFNGRDLNYSRPYVDIGSGSSYRPDRSRIFFTADTSVPLTITISKLNGCFNG